MYAAHLLPIVIHLVQGGHNFVSPCAWIQGIWSPRGRQNRELGGFEGNGPRKERRLSCPPVRIEVNKKKIIVLTKQCPLLLHLSLHGAWPAVPVENRRTSLSYGRYFWGFHFPFAQTTSLFCLRSMPSQKSKAWRAFRGA